MFGPQGLLTPALLLILYAGLMYVVVRRGPNVLRALAATAGLLPATLVGVVVVNDYYEYYTSWDELWYDLSDQNPSGVTNVPDVGPNNPGSLAATLTATAAKQHASRKGMVINIAVPGPSSGIHRNALVFLPPEYFRHAYATYRFPVVEMLHGSPGRPSAWVTGIGAPSAAVRLVGEHRARPAVLVMPDADGGTDSGLQCLDAVHGPKDETYLVDDVPRFVASRLRVQPPGPHWGLVGYSEGGYCAANLALRHPREFGAAGVISGYFVPLMNHTPAGRFDPFLGDRALRDANTPLLELRRLPPTAPLPRFWLAVGGASRADVAQARALRGLLLPRQPDVPLMIVKGEAHTRPVWRDGFPAFFSWATERIAPPR